MPEGRGRVLLLCTHNSARSQTAEGLLGDRFEAYSAGTMEATRVRPEAVEVMRGIGADISGQESETLDRYLGEPFDLVVTVCDAANEACTVSPGAERAVAGPLGGHGRRRGAHGGVQVGGGGRIQTLISSELLGWNGATP